METFNLTLKRTDAFQLLDGLESRAVAWEYTCRHLSGVAGLKDELMIPEECSAPEEATSISRHFRDLIADISKQIAGQ